MCIRDSTDGGTATWTIDDVVVTSPMVSLEGLEAGTSLVYIYSVVSDCDASCTANASVTLSIDEIKWNPCMTGLETDYCAADGLVDTVEFIAGSPFETVIFSGFGSADIPVTDGSNLLPSPFPVEPGDSPENYAGGLVEVCSPMNYYCGTNNELVTMNLSYNYLSDLTAVNGDWDSLGVVGPGGVVIVSDSDPISPADELFDDVIVSYDDILAAYAPFGGQDFLNALVSSCEPMCFEYYLITRCLLYTSPSPRDATLSRMPSSA